MPSQTSLGLRVRSGRKPTSSNHKRRGAVRVHAVGQMRREASLARTDNILIVADGVDFRVRDAPDGFEVVWVAEQYHWRGH